MERKRRHRGRRKNRKKEQQFSMNEAKKIPYKKIGIIAGSIVGGLLLIYTAISIFFMSHFYYNTKINGIDFSLKSAKDVENYIKEQVKDYELTIREMENKTDLITGEEISIKYKEGNEIKNALKKQSPFLWPSAFFSKRSLEVTVGVDYDEAVLGQKIEKLKCVTNPEPTEPVSAYPKFDGSKFVPEKEVLGTKINKEMLVKKIKEHISGFKHELDMQAEGCYAMPQYTSESKEVKEACDKMNAYCKASITYSMGSTQEVVDKTLISTWVTNDASMNVTFDESKVTEYMAEFGRKYDTIGKTRALNTPTGKYVEVSGGDYGWSVDEAAEVQALIGHIKNGEVLTKEPAYEQTAANRDEVDWGSTYLEVDLSAQYMWFIVDGQVAFESAVVTGLPIPSRETPPGTYQILEKLRGTTLVGEIVPETGEPEYKTPVDFWMRVTWSGIGFHDATWQPAFGGNLYQSIGSHGCINMPYDAVATLFDMVAVGTPTIVHY